MSDATLLAKLELVERESFQLRAELDTAKRLLNTQALQIQGLGGEANPDCVAMIGTPLSPWQIEAQELRDQLAAVFGALPVEFGITFTGDYAAYTRAIVEQLRREPIIPAPLAGYEVVKSGRTVFGDLFWHADAQRSGWHHVHGENADVSEYAAVIRKKKV